MVTPKKKRTRPKKKKGSVVVSQKAKIVRKDGQTAKKDTLQRMDAQMPRTAGTVFKVKIKKK